MSDTFIGPEAVNVDSGELCIGGKDADAQCKRDNNFRISNFSFVFELGSF